MHIEKIKFFGEKGFCGYDFHIRYRFNRSSQSLNLVLQIHHSCDIRESVLSTYGEFVLTNLSSLSRNKSSVFLLVLALIVGGVGAQATGLLNTSSGGYLVCVKSTTKVVTHPGTSSCPKGSKKLVLGAQGAAGTNGLTGATGLSGRDGSDGKDGKTLWNGVKDPESTWGAPGDMFINSVTKTLFGPKDVTTGWPAGVSMVGPAGAAGPAGATGAQGPGGASGGSGPAGPAGANGTNATIAITELFVCDGTDEGTVADEKCKIGMTGPGGGLIFFVDYNDQYAGFNYLEAAPQGWGNGITVNQGGLTGETTGSATVDPLMKWCSDTTSLLNLNLWSHSGVGKGATNTSTADTTCAGGAIQAAADYAGGSQTNWFLPSIGEAMLMYTNLRQAGVGGFVGYYYWSSSENLRNYAWNQFFAPGDQSDANKDTSLRVRPVRAFF